MRSPPGESLGLIAELKEREESLGAREEAALAAEERIFEKESRIRLLEALEAELHKLAEAEREDRSSVLDRRERQVVNRERSLAMRLDAFESRQRKNWEAENERTGEEEKLRGELKTRDARIAELEHILSLHRDRPEAA